jgi:hypothetical protein
MSDGTEQGGGIQPPDHQGPWFVRHAGRQTGPFDLERVRTMARRGAVTRMHSLSRDGRSWEPAANVHEVFNPDGSVASGSSSGGFAAGEQDPVFDAPAGRAVPAVSLADRSSAPAPHGERAAASALPSPRVADSPAARREEDGPAPGMRLVPVRPVMVAALVAATLAFGFPTSRTGDGSLGWWWSEGVLGIAIRGVSAVALAAFWSIAFLRPDPVRATLGCAAAAILAAVACAPLWDFASWSIPASLLVPVCALLVSVATAGRPAAGTAATVAGTVALAAVLVTGVLVILHPHPWAFAGVALTLAGGVGTAVAATRTVRTGASDAVVLVGCVAGACGGLGAVFASGLVALDGGEPMGAARAAAGAVMTLGFSTVAWAFAHESVQTAHLVMADGDDASNDGP